MSDGFTGPRVRTPDGQEGTIAREVSHGTLTLRVPTGMGFKRVEAYAVLLDSGEVRFYVADALSDPIRRSGSLN